MAKDRQEFSTDETTISNTSSSSSSSSESSSDEEYAGPSPPGDLSFLANRRAGPINSIVYDNARGQNVRRLPTLQEISRRMTAALGESDSRIRHRMVGECRRMLCTGYRVPELNQNFIFDQNLKRPVPFYQHEARRRVNGSDRNQQRNLPREQRLQTDFQSDRQRLRTSRRHAQRSDHRHNRRQRHFQRRHDQIGIVLDTQNPRRHVYRFRPLRFGEGFNNSYRRISPFRQALMEVQNGTLDIDRFNQRCEELRFQNPVVVFNSPSSIRYHSL